MISYHTCYQNQTTCCLGGPLEQQSFQNAIRESGRGNDKYDAADKHEAGYPVLSFDACLLVPACHLLCVLDLDP